VRPIVRIPALIQLSVILAAGSFAATKVEAGKSYEQLLTVTATVEAIDVAKREVTLKGPEGNLVTLTVGEKVQRLNEVKKGDQVTVEYYIGIAGELRPPTEEEKAQPYVVLDEEARATKESAPAGAVARTVRVVATVEALDLPSQTVTLKGPMGRYLTVRVDDLSKLSKAKLGDTVVVVAAEALAVSVEKAKPKP
jgi:Cu/Ag efflux protein CusF